ncbi:hypothetical protein [Luteimonas panaciterrae]|uniref:hypothetical protein n=1 Tax=Luteimonas panaciterrae TaxID=363885 RepID=UPI001CFA18E1|nr:hypothetical protein [Luteimonas panaciterrae]
MSILASIFGRAGAAEPQAGKLIKEDDPFVDVELPIADHSFSKNGALTVIARGKINGQIVAIAVDLEDEWRSQALEDADLTLYWGNGSIRSLGEESDAFLHLLAHEYGLARPVSKMAIRTKVTLVSFGTDPRRLKSEPAKIKAFFEHNGSDSYAEAFINIDLGNKLLEFRDKDPEYHQGVVSSLSAPS